MKQISNKSKNILLFVMSIVFVAVMILSVYEMCLYRDRMINYETNCEYAGYTENIAAIFISEYADNISSGVGDPMQVSVDTVFGSHRGGREIFNILANRDNVLFYKSTEESANYVDYSMEELTDKFIKDGADNIDELRELISVGKSGSVRMTLDSSNDYYLVYYHNFKIDGKDYGLLHLVLESYYTSNSKVNQHFTYMMVILGVIGIIMVVVIFATAYITGRYNKLFVEKDNEITKYQANIAELNERIENDKKSSKHGNVKDEVLGVYSSYFMNSLVNDAENRGVNTSVAVVGASYRSRYNRQVWNDFISYLKKKLSDNYILGMIDNSHLVLLGVSVDNSVFEKDVTDMLKGAEAALAEDEFIPVYVFDKKNNPSDTISRAIRDAINAFDNNVL